MVCRHEFVRILDGFLRVTDRGPICVVGEFRIDYVSRALSIGIRDGEPDRLSKRQPHRIADSMPGTVQPEGDVPLVVPAKIGLRNERLEDVLQSPYERVLQTAVNGRCESGCAVRRSGKRPGTRCVTEARACRGGHPTSVQLECGLVVHSLRSRLSKFVLPGRRVQAREDAVTGNCPSAATRLRKRRAVARGGKAWTSALVRGAGNRRTRRHGRARQDLPTTNSEVAILSGGRPEAMREDGDATVLFAPDKWACAPPLASIAEALCVKPRGLSPAVWDRRDSGHDPWRRPVLLMRTFCRSGHVRDTTRLPVPRGTTAPSR